LYEQWDCPQVVIKHAYQALEPDELTLDNGDVVNVLRKMKDDGELIRKSSKSIFLHLQYLSGWYFGERIRDGTQGWFPGNYAEEVHSSHVRARNLKQRHRLLLYTATYLESQKEPGTKKK
jgi:neuronal guanine nucleotide exchange factor